MIKITTDILALLILAVAIILLMSVCFKPYNVAELNKTLILKNILKFVAIYWLSCAILGALYGIICALIF